MNVRRFTARTSRDALALVREAFGDDAVVLSTKPCDEGVAVLAMAAEGMQQIEHLSAPPQRSAAPAKPAGLRARLAQSVGVGLAGSASRAAADRPEPFLASPSAAAAAPAAASSVSDDVRQLAMSTLSFQDYVRERMLKRRDAALKAEAAAAAPVAEPSFAAPASSLPTASVRQLHAVPPPAKATPAAPAGALASRMAALPRRAPLRAADASVPHPDLADPPLAQPGAHAVLRREPPVLRDEIRVPAEPRGPSPGDIDTARRDQQDMMSELRSMKGLIEERFDALAFIERMQRQPAQARLTQRLFDCGFSPALIRKLAESLTPELNDEMAWASGVLERNLITAESEPALEDQGGVYALVGATGVGKTTTTAKIAAAFATRYGAANLGLITLDAYRIGAHEQLRAYGRILGVPVHTAHDRASLEDLLDLLSAKKMVLIDTAGMAQRDARTRELLDMLSHRSIQKLLVVNAASQGETIEDVMIAYHAPLCAGIVLSKMDEAVKLGPALDALIRLKLKVIGVANGQRVPEDWHRLSANALVHRALRGGGSSAYKLDASDVSLIFTAPIGGSPGHTHAAHAALHA